MPARAPHRNHSGLGPGAACAGAGGNKGLVCSFSLETDKRKMSDGLRARGELARVGAQRANSAAKFVARNERAQLRTIVRNCTRFCTQQGAIVHNRALLHGLRAMRCSRVRICACPRRAAILDSNGHGWLLDKSTCKPWKTS